MNKLVQKIIIQVLLFVTAVLFGFKFVELDVLVLTDPTISIVTWTMVTMILVFDFTQIFEVKDKRIIPGAKAGGLLLIIFGLWRSGNTNDIAVALSLVTTGVLAVFVISLFFEGEDINLVDKTTRYIAVLAAALLVFDIITGYVMHVNRHNNHVNYFIAIVATQVINRANIEYLVFKLSKGEECKTYFSERKKAFKFGIEVAIQSGFYISIFLLLTTTLETQLLSLFPEFASYKVLLCFVIATAIIATHSMEPKKHLMLTVVSNIKWVATFSIRMSLLYFAIQLLEDFSFEYIIIIGFIFTMVTLFTKFISTNWMSKRSYKLPVYLLLTFMFYSLTAAVNGSTFDFKYSDLRFNLNLSLSILFIIFTLHMVYGVHKKEKLLRLETIGVIAIVTVSLSIIANTIILGFALSVSESLSAIGVDDFDASDIQFINIVLLSGSAILAYIPVITNHRKTTLLFTVIKYLGIFYIFNFAITKASIISEGITTKDVVTIFSALISIVIARGISEKRIKFGWVILFGLMLIFTIEFIYMAVTWMKLFDTSQVNFNGFRILYALYFCLTAFAYIYIRNIRIGKKVRVYSFMRFITSAALTSVLFLATVWGRAAPNLFDLSKIDDEILEEIMGGIMEEFPSVDWCEVLEETGVGDEIGVNCGNYIILPEEESHENSFRDGVATEFDAHSGTWDIESSYGSTTNSSGTSHDEHTSYDYESIMNDPSILSSWFNTKTDYNIKLEIPFGATRNTIPTTMYSDLISTSTDININSDEANILGVSKLTTMDYTINYRVLNSVGQTGFINLLNGSSGSTSAINDGYIEVPTSMNTMINELVSEFQALSIGQVSGDYNVINAIAAFINTKYEVISGLPDNPAAMTITDLKNFTWYDNAPISDQIEAGTLTYSSAVSLQTLMASRLNIKTRISNQLVPMLSADGVPGLFPLGVPRIEMAAPTILGGVWTDVTVATPVPSNNSGVLVSGLSSGEDVFLRRNVVEYVDSEAGFTNHTANDFSSSNGFIYGETPYGSAGISTNDVLFNVTYNPLFTSPMQLFTYGTQSYNGSSNGINISNTLGLAQQPSVISESQVHVASIVDMSVNDTLKQIALNEYDETRVTNGSGTTIENTDAENIARTLYSSYEIEDSDDPTVIQTITQARLNINKYIEDILNNNDHLKEKYTTNKEAFIDSIFVEYNRLLGIDIRIVSGFTANQNGSDTLDANPSHMFELYVDDNGEDWIPLPTYLQSSKQINASSETQDPNNIIGSIFDTIDSELTNDENLGDFDFIGKKATVALMNDDIQGSTEVDLGTEIDITTNAFFATTDPIFNDYVFGHSLRVIEGEENLTNITDTTFVKVGSGDVIIEVIYKITSTGERVTQLFEITDTGVIPVEFEGIDSNNMDIETVRDQVGNIYSISNFDNNYTVYAYEGTVINYCAFIEYIHFPGTSKPNESADESNLTGLSSCSQEIQNATHSGRYTGNIEGIDYTQLPVDFTITTRIKSTNLGSGNNTNIDLVVYEGEKFNIRTFLEHEELVGARLEEIWINGVLTTSDEYIFEANANGTDRTIQFNFNIEGINSSGSLPQANVLQMTVKPAIVTINTITSLDDALNGDSLGTLERDYVTLTQPNASIAYVNSNGGLSSAPGLIVAPWFLNEDRHSNNYDLIMESRVEGTIDGRYYEFSNTSQEVTMFVNGVWQNINVNDLNATLGTVFADVDARLQYSFKTNFSYSIDSVNINRESNLVQGDTFRVVDDKILITVNETNRTPNELTTISGSGWVFEDKLEREVAFTVEAVSTDGTVNYTNGQFVFGQLSADYTQGHEFRIYATSPHSNLEADDNPTFIVQLNDIEVEMDRDPNFNYYVNYPYDISSLLDITDWNGKDISNESNIVWSVTGGATFNPTSYNPQLTYEEITATITYAQRVYEHNMQFRITDPLNSSLIANVEHSDDVEAIQTAGLTKTYAYTFTEEQAITTIINVCDLFSVTDHVTNSSLGVRTSDTSSRCILDSTELDQESSTISLVYNQHYGRSVTINLKLTREDSIFDVASISSIRTIHYGRTVRLELTYYRTINDRNYFFDNNGQEMSLPTSDRTYKVGESIKFIFDVSQTRNFNLEVVGDESDFESATQDYRSVLITADLSSNYRLNQSEFNLEEVDGKWFIAGTEIDFEEMNQTFFNGKFVAYENETYNVKWIYNAGEVYMVDYYQTHPPSKLIFYMLIGAMISGIIYLVIHKIRNRPEKIVEEVQETKEEILEVEAISKEEEIKLIHELIMERIRDLFETVSEVNDVVHKGNLTWRKYCVLIAESIEDSDKEEWEAFADVLDRCAYFKSSLEWIHFNYIEQMYQETYSKLNIEDNNKTKKY